MDYLESYMMGLRTQSNSKLEENLKNLVSLMNELIES